MVSESLLLKSLAAKGITDIISMAVFLESKQQVNHTQSFMAFFIFLILKDKESLWILQHYYEGLSQFISQCLLEQKWSVWVIPIEPFLSSESVFQAYLKS